MSSRKLQQSQSEAVRAAYVHVPFCRHRCGYCNFTVIAERDDLIQDYLRAIEIELGWLGQPREVDTLFFGGGTPTHLPPDMLERFLDLVMRWLPVSANGEISVEANPEDINQDCVDVLAGAAVDRVSLGVQSFRDDKLQTLERTHRSDEVGHCLELLRPNVRSLSLDLIFGTPNETLEDWRRDLDAALKLNPDHMSTYGLTYEPGTQFHTRKEKQELAQLPEALEGEMYELAIEQLGDHGFEHYEVSNFAKPTHRCRHNVTYWKCKPFYGIGPGASAFVDNVRQSNHRSTTTWLKKVLNDESPVEERDELNEEELAHERLVFGLRMLEGVRIDDFESQTGVGLMELAGDAIKWLCSEGLLEQTDGTVKLTRKGLLVSDSIWPHLL